MKGTRECQKAVRGQKEREASHSHSLRETRTRHKRNAPMPTAQFQSECCIRGSNGGMFQGRIQYSITGDSSRSPQSQPDHLPFPSGHSLTCSFSHSHRRTLFTLVFYYRYRSYRYHAISKDDELRTNIGALRCCARGKLKSLSLSWHEGKLTIVGKEQSPDVHQRHGNDL